MKVYVLSYLCDPTDEMSANYVLMVSKNKKDVQKAMKQELENVVQSLEVTEEEKQNFNVKISEGENDCSLYHYGSYYEWKISEFEI